MFMENEYATYTIKDGILHVEYKNVNLDLSAAISIVEDRFALQKGQSIPVLCDIRRVNGINRTARIYLSIEGSSFINAVAFIVEAPVSDMFSKFYLRSSKQTIPTMVFTMISEALMFLKKYK
ncbi:MAG: hypothetical protein WA749_10995 [Gelidibacter sp.]